MFTMIYDKYSADEINQHWVNQGIPAILQELSIKGFSLGELKQALKSLENLPKNDDKNDVKSAVQVKYALNNGQRETDYLLGILDKLSVMAA